MGVTARDMCTGADQKARLIQDSKLKRRKKVCEVARSRDEFRWWGGSCIWCLGPLWQWLVVEPAIVTMGREEFLYRKSLGRERFP